MKNKIFLNYIPTRYYIFAKFRHTGIISLFVAFLVSEQMYCYKQGVTNWQNGLAWWPTSWLTHLLWSIPDRKFGGGHKLELF